MKTRFKHSILALSFCALVASPAAAQEDAAPLERGSGASAGSSASAAAPHKLIVTIGASDLATFERDAVIAHDLGATHMTITDDLPPAFWEFDSPDDPYPAWYFSRPDFVKLFPPKEVRPFVDAAYAEKVVKILEERCAILRKHGLKAHWSSNIPQVLPEAFFAAYPHLRGPRVDQPNRSRVARFSPCVDEPDTLRIYAEAMKSLLQHCPEIDSFQFLTQDSGSGFCWAPALYPGTNGPGHCEDRPMEQRVSSFLVSLQKAAAEAGHAIEINMNEISPRQWMLPAFHAMDIVRLLPRGLAVDGREGPDGRSYSRSLGGGGRSEFYPVMGLPVPALTASRAGRGSEATREMLNFGDAVSADFNVRLFRATRASAPKNDIERLVALRAFAVGEVGEAHADDMLTMWSALTEAERGLNALNFGGMLRFGHVLGRWIARPIVPFPAELKPEEKAYYRKFLFQAKGEKQADDLIDIQAMRMYEGWGAKMLFQRVIETVVPRVAEARRAAVRIRDGATDEKIRRAWDLTVKRIDVLDILLHSADNMVAFQAHLDRLKNLGVKPEENPVLGVQSDWARTDMIRIARREIDNAIALKRLLETTSDEPLLDMAATPAEESIMRLSPSLPAQLKSKIDIMNAHWRDYDRLFTVPNP